MASSSAFAQSCAGVFELMINTVPSTVELTEEIVMLPAKVSNVGLTVDHGELVFKASLRV